MKNKVTNPVGTEEQEEYLDLDILIGDTKKYKLKSILHYNENYIVGYRLTDLETNEDIDYFDTKQLKEDIAVNPDNYIDISINNYNQIITGVVELEKYESEELEDLYSYEDNTIKAIGYKNPMPPPFFNKQSNVERMFGHIDVTDKEIILQDWNFGRCQHLNSMFRNLKAKKLVMKNCILNNIKMTQTMFENCDIKTVDISDIKMNIAFNMVSMFKSSKIEELDMSRAKLKYTMKLTGMFAYSEIDSLKMNDIESININVTSFMFFMAKINNLQLINFNTTYVQDMQQMFAESEIPEIDLTSFDFINVDNTKLLFGDCKTNKISLPENSLLDSFNQRDLCFAFLNCTVKKENIKGLSEKSLWHLIHGILKY